MASPERRVNAAELDSVLRAREGAPTETVRWWTGIGVRHVAIDDLLLDLRDARRELAVQAEALDESVALQSHQARLLNQYDGGERREFADGAAWIARLRECGRLPAEPAPTSPPENA